MDNLPIELYYHIFDYLRVSDLFIVRLISKKFNWLIQEFRVKDLVFEVLQNDIYYRRFLTFSTADSFHLNRLVNCKNLIDESKLFVLISSPINIQYLKSLSIHLEENCIIKLNDINQLKQLEHLDIKLEFSKHFLDAEQQLSLPKLKSLCLNFGEKEFSGPSLVIDTPQLKSLNFDSFNLPDYLGSIKFIDQSSIRYLRIKKYCQFFKLFKEIEYLECYDGENINSNILSHFSNLKEIQVIRGGLPKLKELVKQKSDLNRQVKIYFCGFELINGNEIECLSELDYFSDEEFDENLIPYLGLHDFINHFPEKSDHLKRLDFSYLMRKINVIPKDLFQKFRSIEDLYVLEEVKDEKNLIKVIENCHNLSTLTLENSKLNQSFYDELASVSSLVQLSVFENGNVGLNFKFINKLFNLSSFKTNQQLDLNDQYDLNKLIYLDAIEFKINHLVIKIFKSNRARNKYRFYGFGPKEQFDYEELLNHCANLKISNGISSMVTRSTFKKMRTSLA